MLAARQDCLAQGLEPGTTALSQCELTGRGLAQNAPPVLQAASPMPAVKSYFGASSDEIRHREQRACAEIGYDPAGAGFGQCVADLGARLESADYPVR